MTDYTEEYWKEKERADKIQDELDEALEQVVTLRPEVQEFAFALERTLRKNDHKGGWQQMTFSDCMERAADESVELDDELRKPKPSLKKVRHEIEDWANFLLFAWHNAQDEFWRNDK